MRGLYITFTPQYVREFVVTYEPETEAFLNAITISNDSTTYFGSTAYEITGAEIWTALDGCVVQMKTALGLTLGVNNLSTKFKFIYPRIGGTSTKHAYNLVTATQTATYSGGWTHDGSGAEPNGTNGYMDTGYTYTSTNFTQNNQSFGFLSKTNTNGLFADFGAQNTGYADVNMYGRVSNNLNTRLGDNVGNSTTATSDSLGLLSISRTSSTQYKHFKDGALIGTKTTNSTSFSGTPYQIYEGASNNTGPAIQYSPRKRTWFWAGLGMTDTEMADIYSALATFETALNR